jgi:hypothetical protein
MTMRTPMITKKIRDKGSIVSVITATRGLCFWVRLDHSCCLSNCAWNGKSLICRAMSSSVCRFACSGNHFPGRLVGLVRSLQHVYRGNSISRYVKVTKMVTDDKPKQTPLTCKCSIVSGHLLATACPLGLTYLLNYWQWEVLTLFVVALGPAEMVAWAILGYPCSILKYISDGVADASESRCALHLVVNEPNLA